MRLAGELAWALASVGLRGAGGGLADRELAAEKRKEATASRGLIGLLCSGAVVGGGHGWRQQVAERGSITMAGPGGILPPLGLGVNLLGPVPAIASCPYPIKSCARSGRIIRFL